VDATSWIDDPSYRRSYGTSRRTELDGLLIAVGTGRDCGAYARLFAHFQPRVRAQLLRLGLNSVAAEDATQDVMETIWRKAHLYDPRKSGATTWIVQIARNRRIDIERRNRECPVAVEDYHDIPDTGERSDDCVQAAQREARVRLALDGLPQDQFAVVKLAFFEGLSHGAIARRLNLPLGTVKSRLRLAFTYLRRMLPDLCLNAA
jgi:RNA polymerase sigma factor (sigma-70 family)